MIFSRLCSISRIFIFTFGFYGIWGQVVIKTFLSAYISPDLLARFQIFQYFYIHALDVATWIVNAHPIKAYGRGGRSRRFLGDCWDHYSVLFFFPNDLIVTFSAKQVGYGFDDIMVRAHGTTGTAETNYGGPCWLHSREDRFDGKTDNIYQVGVERNMVTFYDNITKGDTSNPTVAQSVRSNLTTILGRTAAYKGGEVTWDEMMRANEKWAFDGPALKPELGRSSDAIGK